MYKRAYLFVSFGVLFLLAATTVVEAAQPNLVGWWKLDEGTGAVARDSSGNGNTGTIFGLAQWGPGQRDGALMFDGSHNYVLVDPLFGLAGESLTGLAWIRGDARGRVIASQRGGESWLVADPGSGFLMTPVGRRGLWPERLSSGIPIDDGGWHHVALTWDGTTLTLYENAVLRAFSNPDTIAVSAGALVIGAAGGLQTDTLWSGAMDDVRIYDRSLTQDEIGEAMEGASNLSLKASEPQPGDGAADVAETALLRWTPGETAALHNVYLGTSPDLGPDDLVSRRTPASLYFHAPGFESGVTYYWRIDEIEADGVTVHQGDLWRFSTGSTTALGPYPSLGAMWVELQPVLSWQPGLNAVAHEIYFGKTAAAVVNRDDSVYRGNQPGTTYEPGRLEENVTYYWAVDKMDNTGTISLGDVWTFSTTGPTGGTQVEYFEGRDLEGTPRLVQLDEAVDHNWGLGEVAAGLSDQVSARWTATLEIPVADTYTFVSTTDDGVRVWLDGELIIDDWTDHGATDNVSAQWYLEAGVYALTMEWYDNTGEAVAQLKWQTATMERQIIPAGPLRPVLGPRVVLAIDDFESYQLDAVDILRNWSVDGGASIEVIRQTAAPFHYAGIKSIEFTYVGFSRILRTWTIPQNWDLEGAEALALYIYGDPDNDPAPLFIELTSEDGVQSGPVRVEHPDSRILLTAEWNEWRIPLSSLSGASVDLTAVRALSIGVGLDPSPDPNIIILDPNGIAIDSNVVPLPEPNLIRLSSSVVSASQDPCGVFYMSDVKVIHPSISAGRLRGKVWIEGTEKLETVSGAVVTLLGDPNRKAVTKGDGSFEITVDRDSTRMATVTACGFNSWGPEQWQFTLDDQYNAEVGKKPELGVDTTGSGAPGPPVYRFRSPPHSTDWWYFTADQEERDQYLSAGLARDPSYDGIAFFSAVNDGLAVPVHRFRHIGGNGTPAYSVDPSDTFGTGTWEPVGGEPAFFVYPRDEEGQRTTGTPDDTIPVYRFWSRACDCYFYTTNRDEPKRWESVGADWQDQGIVWYAYSCVGGQ
ncbi:MAG: hypothetical protein JW741_20025 [Sedimentisphaerales bacterium]|nr:hypothetical protein [Sedimentisphaerales bacterium]